jgi:hypothetical protein
MDRRFAADEWADLTNSERIRRCQLMADEALKLSRAASPNLAEGYLRLAGEWLKLAKELALDATGGSAASS